jgi:hypothetical protein
MTFSPIAPNLRYTGINHSSVTLMSQAELLLDDLRSVEEHRWRTLPPEQQQALMDVATELVAHPPALTPKRNLKGPWADRNIDLDEQDLHDLRQEICPRV